MTDPDPPDEVDDVKSPGHRDHDPEETDTDGDQGGDRIKQYHHQYKRDAEADIPESGSRPGQYDGADLVGDGGVGVPRLDNGRACSRLHRVIRVFGRHGATPLRVQGWDFLALRDIWFAAAYSTLSKCRSSTFRP